MELIKYNPIDNVFEKSKDGVNTLLPQIMWHITSKCRLNCVFCFAKKEKDCVFDIDQTISLLKKLNVLKVDISGGEPLLSSQFSSICDLLYKNKFNMTVTTTGFGDEENFKWLMKNSEKFSRVIFSIDGDKALHDKLRKRQGIFEYTIDKITQLRSLDVKIRINTVVTKDLINSNFYELIFKIDKLFPYEWCLIQIHPANDKGEYEKLQVSNEEFNSFVDIIKSISTSNVIQRKRDDYSGYWAINSDNTISMHSDKSEDKFSVEIKEENYLKIEGAINMEKSKYPINENNEIRIVNVNNSENISTMLQAMEDICNKNRYECRVNRETLENKKCEVITTIVMGLATNAIYDLLKYAYNKIKKRVEQNSNDEIIINEIQYSVSELEELIENYRPNN